MMPHVLLYTPGCEEAPTKLATSVLGRRFFSTRHFLWQNVFIDRLRHTARALSAEQAAANFFMQGALPLESRAAELAARWAAACQVRRRRQRFIIRLIVAVPR